MTTQKIGKNTTPLCFFKNGKLLFYHRGKVILLTSGSIEKTIHIHRSLKERLLGGSRIISRLLRFGVRAAEAIDDSHAILSIGNKLYELDVEKGNLTDGWFCGTGIRPLIMTPVKGINGIKDGVYFGGYLVNKEKKPVNIYHRVGVDNWEVVYTFPQGTINHVHNIVPDSFRQCLWVFTGDFDDSAAIWKVTDNFNKIERIACNDQKYRGCVVYALPEGLLYATDAPFADNYIYLMNTETYQIQTVFPLHGSCIYGCRWRDKYVFSSTVESDGRASGKKKPLYKRLLYTGNRGAGIKDDFAHLYIGNLGDGFKEIYKEEKDCLSFLFQFGVFKFPYGKNNTDILYFQPVATKKNDMRLLGIGEEEL